MTLLPGMFLSLNIHLEYWIIYVIVEDLCVKFIFATGMFCMGVPVVATNFPAVFAVIKFSFTLCVYVHRLEI